jgi:copper(I)-binding protein
MIAQGLVRFLALAGFLAASAVAAARPGVIVSEAWTRPAAPGMTAAGYMSIANPGAVADALDGASSPIARRVTLHQSRLVGNVSVMRPLASLPLPAHGRASLAPGGLHLMFEGLKRPLKGGDRAPVTLRFRRAGPVRVWLAVRGGPSAMTGMKM